MTRPVTPVTDVTDVTGVTGAVCVTPVTERPILGFGNGWGVTEAECCKRYGTTTFGILQQRTHPLSVTLVTSNISNTYTAKTVQRHRPSPCPAPPHATNPTPTRRHFICANAMMNIMQSKTNSRVLGMNINDAGLAPPRRLRVSKILRFQLYFTNGAKL